MALDQAGVQLIAQGVAGYVSDVQKANKATESIGTSANKAAGLVQDAAGRWRTATGRFATDLEKAAAGIAPVGTAAKGAGDAAKKAGDDAAHGGSGFNTFKEIAVGALREVGAMAVQFGVQAAKAVAGFVEDSIKKAGDFEAGMNQFRQVAGKEVDAKGLEKFKDLFITLGKELPVSTSEVQQAAIEMIKGGIDPATLAAGGLRQNIQFAAAAMKGDLVQAAEISSKILGGWTGINATAAEKAAFLTRSTDLLTKAANASSTDVHELSLGIFRAQGIAQTAGVSFDDLTTALAELAPRFSSSAVAGDSLKNVIARLQPTTKKQTAMMIDLGLITDEGANKFYNAQGSFVGFQQASQVLQDSLVGLTDQQKQVALQTIFGNDAMNAAAGLAELGAAGYQKMADSLANANGVAEGAAITQQGFNIALENAKGSVEALQITLGSALLPVLTDLLNNVVAPAVNTLTDMTSAVLGSNEAFARLSPTAQAVVSFIRDLVSDVQRVIGAFQSAGAMSSEFARRIGDLASDLGLPGKLITQIVGAVQDLIGAFSSAESATGDLRRVMADLSGVWQNIIKLVQDVSAAYLNVVQAVLPIVTKFWQQHGTEITAFLQTAYDKIISIVNLTLQLYDAIVPPILNNIARLIEEHATGIQAVLTGAWQVISAVIDGALTLIEGILKIALDLIKGDWSKAWTDLQTMSATFVLDIGKLIEGFLNIIAGFFDTSLADILKTWEYNWNTLVSIVSNIDWRAVGAGVISGIRSGISAGWGALKSYVAGLAHDLLNAAKSALGISSPSILFANKVGEPIAMGILIGIQQALPQVLAGIASMGEDMLQAGQKIADDVQNAIAGAFGATASMDRQKAKNLADFQKLASAQQGQAKFQLETAEALSQQLTDPKQAAAFYALRSKQIFEIAKLQQQIDATADTDQRARLAEQLALIESAQRAEVNQFNAAVVKSPLADIADQIHEALQKISGGTVVEPNQVQYIEALNAMWEKLVASVQTPTGPYTPYYAPQPISNTTNLNMPIYTNQSPSVLQSSMAIAGAALL